MSWSHGTKVGEVSSKRMLQGKICRIFLGVVFFVGGIGGAWNPPAETIQKKSKQFLYIYM